MALQIMIIDKWKDGRDYYVIVRDEKAGIDGIGKSNVDYIKAHEEAVEKLKELVEKYTLKPAST